MSETKELKDYLVDNYKDTNFYTAKLWRGGLSDFAPLIVSCAITGGNAGKEATRICPKALMSRWSRPMTPTRQAPA